MLDGKGSQRGGMNELSSDASESGLALRMPRETETHVIEPCNLPILHPFGAFLAFLVKSRPHRVLADCASKDGPCADQRGDEL